MKLLFDFFPILLFFIAYKFFGIFSATCIAMAVALAQTFFLWFKYRRLEILQITSLVLIAVLGSATLIFHNELFIKWKPTAINFLFGLAFLGSQFIGEKPLIKRLFSEHLKLPKTVWSRLNIAWCLFFVFLGCANIYVIYNFDTDFWVNFKLFGMLGLTVIFVILQSVYLLPYLQQAQQDSTNAK